MSISRQASFDLPHSSNSHDHFKDLRDPQDACGISNRYFPSTSTMLSMDYNLMYWQQQNSPTFSTHRLPFTPARDSTAFTSTGVDPRSINPMLSENVPTASGEWTHHRLSSREAINSFRDLSCERLSDTCVDQPTLSYESIGYPESPGDLSESLHINLDYTAATAEEKTPYNKLLFQCLAEAPHNEMCLKDIYAWFRENTSKGSMPDDKGWQNSIRHNLSMNQAFRRGARSDRNRNEKNMWSLTEDALKNGIEPTTRYRRSDRPCSRSRPLDCPRPLTGVRDVRVSKRLSDKKAATQPSSAPATPSRSLLQTPESQRCDTPASLQNISTESSRSGGLYYQSAAVTPSPRPISIGVDSERQNLNSNSFLDPGFQVSDLPLQNRHQGGTHVFQSPYHEHQSNSNHCLAAPRVDELVFGTPPLTETSYPSPRAYHQPQDMGLNFGPQRDIQVPLNASWENTGLQPFPSSYTLSGHHLDEDYISHLDPNDLGDPHSVLKSVPGAPLFYDPDREEDLAFYRDDIDECGDDDADDGFERLAPNDLSAAPASLCQQQSLLGTESLTAAPRSG